MFSQRSPGHEGAGPDSLAPDPGGEELGGVHVHDPEAGRGAELAHQGQNDLKEVGQHFISDLPDGASMSYFHTPKR